MTDQNNPETGNESSFETPAMSRREFFNDLVGAAFDTIKTALFLSPLFIVVIVVILALMGPAVGNIFSNIVSSL